LYPQFIKAQISEGGTPIQVLKSKSSSIEATDLVVMPQLDNEKLQKQFNQSGESTLKRFVFAHTFDVSYTLKNSGNWYNTSAVNVWQLRVRSSGAYSLNFVFENFRIPKGARLFLINNDTGETKGAYTSQNNPESGIFAIEPISGDEIMIQYEEPVKPEFQGEFMITKISHDFIGITADNRRRNPNYPSGTCNVNINCDVANAAEANRDAVCKIVIVSEVCTGTMINNTAQDDTPYVLTANHCINTAYKAQASVFLFNYEAPYCSYYNSPTIDGDISNSLSGSTIKASFDSLDFALVRLNQIPPYNYRIFLSGWNRINVLPTSSLCIHHPWGDVKKVAIDLDAPITDTYKDYIQYFNKGFWHILSWDYGVTEKGSSGGPLFDQNQRLIGSLTGGGADCFSRKNDYFEKFALSWSYRKEVTKQLKAWLDPLNTYQETLDGKYMYSGKSLCKPVTNFKNTDTQAIVEINGGVTKKGYWSGTNTAGITEIAEQYKFAKNCEIHGVSLGIAKVKVSSSNAQPFINIKVFEGTSKPETLVRSETYDIRNLVTDAMNYIAFASPVKTNGNFYISVGLSNLTSADTLIVYMANRKSDTTNSFFLKNNSGWTTYNTQNLLGNGSALLTELVACNIDDPFNSNQLLVENAGAKLYPNPLIGNTELKVITNDPIDCPENVEVFDLLGKSQNIAITNYSENKLGLNFSGKRPGIYVVRLMAGGRQIEEKISYFP